MPQIRNITLHSFSSEDPNFRAQNLLETKVTKKWKCEKAGEKTAFVILKFDKPYKLTDINVGNEFSGVIEVLVGNSQQVPTQFHELLLATSLMSVIEARTESMPNRVRMFSKDVFNPLVADKKWDLIKIVVSQTFNNHRQFGLSFIDFNTDEEVTEKSDEDSPIKPVKIAVKPPVISPEKTPGIVKPAKKTFGKFKFRDSNSDDEEETSPFAQWKFKKENPQSSLNTQKITPKSESKTLIKEQLKAKLDSENKRKREKDDEVRPKNDRNRSKGLFYDSSDDEPNEKLQKKMEKDKELRNKESSSTSQKVPIKPIPTASPLSNKSKFASFIKHDDDEDKTTRDESKRKVESSTSQKTTPPIKKDIKYKPFDKLMDGVIFVISGYQNPERGIMRQKAIDMGAKYKADWDDACTHLICAYANTPKYNQVRGKGKIVSKKWIETCFTEQKLIPWRRFALDPHEKNQPESDEEILCEWNKPKPPDAPKENIVESDDSDSDMLIVDRRTTQKDVAPVLIDDSESDSDMIVVKKTSSKTTGDDDDDNVETKKSREEGASVSQQVRENEDSNNNNKNNDSKRDEDENSSARHQPLNDDYSDDSVSSIDITTVECQAFRNKTFYLNEDLSATDIIKLKDNIKNMLGVVTKNPRKANYIISKYGKRVPHSINGEVVKEIWIRECFDLQAFIPTNRYKF